MSGEWKPGDVAMARIQLWSGLVLCTGPGEWVTDDGDGRWETHQLADLRPLAVIDPEDREQAARLIALFSEQFTSWSSDGERDAPKMQAALREFADPKPPKPEEPTGLGAVVEDEDGVRWLRLPDWSGARRTPWASADKDAERFDRSYAGIDVVRVLSEGVQA